MSANLRKIGFRAGMIAFTATIAYVIVQILQVLEIVKFPADEILIYATSLAIVVPFLVEMLALHYLAPVDKKFWTHGALIFTTLYTVFVSSNYVVQLATVIPMNLAGKLNEVKLLQQTPHSLFWNFDALGYIFMGLACLFAIPAFERKGFQKWVRISLIVNAGVTPLIATVYFYPHYSNSLLFLGFPWAFTAPTFMLMLALYLRKTETRFKTSNI